jgi:hypothetical protein
VVTLKVTDACNRTKIATYTFLVTSGPRPPVPAADSLSFAPDCININPVININALANDVEPDGQPMTITSVTGNNGAWSVNPDKTVKFIPTTGFYGLTTASYTVCDNTTPANLCMSSTIKITIGNTNQAPVAMDDVYSILEDSIQQLNVLINDLPGNGGGPLKIAGIETLPLYGKVSINTDNTITYLPVADNRITDSFYYRTVNAGNYISVAKVKIIVTADGCSPGFYQTCIPGPNPISIIASEDTYLNSKFPTTNYGSDAVIVVDRENTEKQRSLIKFTLPSLTCDTAVTPVITNAVLKLYKSGGGGGSLNVDVYRATSAWTQAQANWNNRLTATAWTTAGGDFNGTLAATTSVNNDGLYTWNISTLVSNWYSDPANYPNYGLLLKTTEGGGDRDPNFVSTESNSGLMKPTLEISYTIPQLCVLIPTRPPLSLPDTVRTNSLTPVTRDVTLNDYFLVGGGLTVSVIPGTISTGTASVSGNTVTYTPPPTFSGIASLQYRVLNIVSGLADTANMFIAVSFTPPVANNDSTIINSGQSSITNVTANDVDPQNIGINASLIASPRFGTYSVSGNTVTYNSPYNFIGRDTLTYRLVNAISGLCNEQNAADTAYLIITVLNRPPVAIHDTASTNPCQPISINVLDNDTDPENGSIAVASVSAPTPADAGTTTTDGNLIYFIPNPAFAGTSASLTYTITDDAIPPALSNTATITINFNNTPNLPPVAINDSANGLMNEETYLNLLDNDADPENDPLTISLEPLLLQPAHGTLTLQANGLLKYTPVTGFTGIDEFEYKLADSHFGPNGASCSSFSQSTIARVRISISNLFFVLSTNDLQLSGTGNGLRNILKYTVHPASFPATCLLQKSTDNRTFKTLTAVPLFNSADAAQPFEWTDYQLQDPAAFYRVSLVKPGYPADYSNTVLIKNAEEKSILQTYPVPFSNQLNARIFTSSIEKMDIGLFNAAGILVRTKSIIPQKGLNDLQFDQLQTLSPGIYIFTATQQGVTTSQKISKQ